MKTYLHPFVDLLITVLILSSTKSQDYNYTTDLSTSIESSFNKTDSEISTQPLTEENSSNETVEPTNEQISQSTEYAVTTSDSPLNNTLNSTPKDNSEYNWWPILLLIILFTICAILGSFWAIVRYSTMKTREIEEEEKRISASTKREKQVSPPLVLPPIAIKKPKKPASNTPSEELDEQSISVSESEPKIHLKVPSDSLETGPPSVTSDESLAVENSSISSTENSEKSTTGGQPLKS